MGMGLCSICRKPDLTDFEREFMDSHNSLRALHKTRPLKYKRDLSKAALQWLEYLVKTNKVEPNPNVKYGQNLLFAKNVDVVGKLPVLSWYDEIRHYDWIRPQYSQPRSRSFCQVVWKSTKTVGVAVKRKGSSVWILAYYNPPGNIHKSYKRNVGKRLDHDIRQK